VIGAAIAVAGGSAGNRDGVGSLKAVPGPGSITYGENISYEATFLNDNENSGAVFTQTKLVMPPPVGPDGAKATPVESSCGTFDANHVLTCSFGKLVPGASVTVRVTWKAPGDPSQPACSVDVDNEIYCLRADATFLIKEGKDTNFNESFAVSAFASLIGVGEADAVNRNTRAGGFETTGFGTTQCETGSSSLATHQDLSSANKFSTSFCLPTFPTDKIKQGLAAWIVEEASTGTLGHPYLGQSTICVAEFLANCGPSGTYPEHEFTTTPITVRLRVLESALLPGDSITQMFHNNKALPWCLDKSTNPPTDNSANENGCVVSITRSSGPDKIITLIGKAKKNGPWGA
jgi:hypothetical protein